MLRYIIFCAALTLAAPATMALPCSLTTTTDAAIAGLTESQKVERLIQFVRGMKGATFIRNGSEHTCKEAADHLQSKWEKHKNQVKSAENFIEEIASRSGMTGQDYLIRFADGTEVTTNEVLTKELKRLEQL